MFGMGVNRQSNKPHFLLLISFIFWSSYSSFVGHTWISSERTWMRRPNYTMRTKIFSSWDGGTRLALHLRAFNSIFAWKKIYEGTLSLQKCCRYWKCTKMISLTQMGTDKRVATPIPFVYWFGLQNLRCRICCRAIKTKVIEVTSIAFQCPYDSCNVVCQKLLFTFQSSLFSLMGSKPDRVFPMINTFEASDGLIPRSVIQVVSHKIF